jgi:hypothetical protein
MTARGKSQKSQGIITLVVIVVLVIAWILFGKKNENYDRREKGFRHHEIEYSKHARCRMDCRHIDESEVKELLEGGKINYSKSQLTQKPCPKYAVEGETHDGQLVRLIVGDCKNTAVIITVIDLGNDYECECD